MTLANKYRPKTFEDITEQDVVVKILQNMCNDLPLKVRNFLFTGPAGTGKTTLARVVANTINCGEGEPLEIDAASHNGVEAIRELVTQARIFPIGCKYKVIIIDECHTLTPQSWQALLKVFEESPARTVFILCTTNPEKIPDTIISRVQVFNLSKISLVGITDRIKYVLESELADGRELSYELDAIDFVAKYAKGGLRDALTTLDKVLMYSNIITLDSVLTALNLPSYDDYFDLLKALAKHDNTKIIKIISNVYESSINFIKWFEGFHSFIVNVIKYIILHDISMTNIPDTYISKMDKYGDAHIAFCMKYASILLSLISDLKSTQYQQEVAITYLCKSKG